MRLDPNMVLVVMLSVLMAAVVGAGVARGAPPDGVICLSEIGQHS